MNELVKGSGKKSVEAVAKEVIAGKAKAEVKDLVENYPKYAKEILGIVAEYDKDFT